MWIWLGILAYLALLALGILFLSGARRLEEPHPCPQDESAERPQELTPQIATEGKQVGPVSPIGEGRRSA